MAKKKKWKKRLKKLAKAALIGGALYGGAKLLKNRRAASIADMDDAGIGVTHPALTDTAPVIKTAPVDTAVTNVRKPPIGRMRGVGTDAEAIAGQDLRAGLSKRVRGIAPPSQLLTPQRTHVGRGVFNYKGGGIAKRGKGAAYKSGGRVTGIAKRGFGRALMKGKK